MEGPSNRVTRGRVLLLAVITFVALAYGSFRWTRSGDSEATTAAPRSGTTAAAPPLGSGASLAPDPPGSPDTISLGVADQVLSCLRANESRGEYTAVSPSGLFFGAYQFDQQTWNNTATHAGLPGLVGVQPNLATPAEQDQLALALLQWQGGTPWHGDPCVA